VAYRPLDGERRKLFENTGLAAAAEAIPAAMAEAAAAAAPDLLLDEEE